MTGLYSSWRGCVVGLQAVFYFILLSPYTLLYHIIYLYFWYIIMCCAYAHHEIADRHSLYTLHSAWIKRFDVYNVRKYM
jgi:hypothetical protein